MEAHLGHSEQFTRILLNMESRTGPLPCCSAGPGAWMVIGRLTLLVIVLNQTQGSNRTGSQSEGLFIRFGPDGPAATSCG